MNRKKDSSNFATNYSGSLNFRDDGKLVPINKMQGKWIKERALEGEEASNEWLKKNAKEKGE
nr:hypothetical protein [bacterium]